MNQYQSILTYFPYAEPRQIQEEALLELERIWNDYDVFVIGAPTAFGKTAVSKTIMNWQQSVSTITPTNMLVDQYREEFPDTRTLSRMDSYWCETWDRPCTATRARLKSFCSEKRTGALCPCSQDLIPAKHYSGPGIYNYHTYMAHKLHRRVLVVDEAHNLIPVIQERESKLIWHHDAHYPLNMFRPEQMQEWIRTLPEHKRTLKAYKILVETLESGRPKYVVERAKEWFNGKGTIRGEPEERDCLKLYPVDISNAPPMFWPKQVEKIVLMSATIGRKDIEALGLHRDRRVAYLHCDSPIPRGNRPIVAVPIATVKRNDMEEATNSIAWYLDHILIPRHSGEKGVIHATYGMAAHLSHILQSHRFMFHTRENKAEVYERFRQSRSEEGRVLVASGMYEGLDLPYDLGRWQAIAKVPWGSLASPAIKYRATTDSDWYNWETLKCVVQACGRICRTPEDYGITYILDETVLRLFEEGEHLLPEWYKCAVSIEDPE